MAIFNVLNDHHSFCRSRAVNSSVWVNRGPYLINKIEVPAAYNNRTHPCGDIWFPFPQPPFALVLGQFIIFLLLSFSLSLLFYFPTYSEKSFSYMYSTVQHRTVCREKRSIFLIPMYWPGPLKGATSSWARWSSPSGSGPLPRLLRTASSRTMGRLKCWIAWLQNV